MAAVSSTRSCGRLGSGRGLARHLAVSPCRLQLQVCWRFSRPRQRKVRVPPPPYPRTWHVTVGPQEAFDSTGSASARAASPPLMNISLQRTLHDGDRAADPRARPAGGPGRIFSRGPRSAYASRQFLQIALPIAFDSPVRTVPGTSRGRGRSVNSLRLGVPLPPPAASACLLDIVYRSDYSPRSAPLRAETPLRVRVRAAACGGTRAACPYVRALNDGRNPSVSTATVNGRNAGFHVRR